jgi:hypothetical protein
MALAARGFGPARAADPGLPTRVLAHYMPWFVARPSSPVWGWHWTMNAFDPETVQDGRRRIASHYYPLIGPYDSSDPIVVEYHLLSMKLAGFDGLIVDWYGTSDLYDYPIIHRNTSALFSVAARFGLSVAICYEDQSVSKLVEAGKLAGRDRVRHVKETLAWLRSNWFSEACYLRHEGRPVLLSFGSTGLTDEEWTTALPRGGDAPVYLSEHRRRAAAAGAFDWPKPADGLDGPARFDDASRGWPVRMPCAFPRFHDVYAEAKVHASYGRIADDDGRTFAATLRRAFESRAPFVQVATWNDWGEGTAVEPSLEYGSRDLETLQRLRRERIDPRFATDADALRLAHRLYLLRRRQSARRALDEAARLLAAGRLAPARAELDRIEAMK